MRAKLLGLVFCALDRVFRGYDRLIAPLATRKQIWIYLLRETTDGKYWVWLGLYRLAICLFLVRWGHRVTFPRTPADALVNRVSFDSARVIALRPPFNKEVGWAWWTPFQDLSLATDGPEQSRGSPLVLLEDGQPLWLRHSSHEDIRILGGGRYSHWIDQRIYLSTSDNSNPNTNGRSYAVVVADSA